jgi:hypothetical protein
MTRLVSGPWNPVTDTRPAWLQRVDRLKQAEVAAETGDEPVDKEERETKRQADYSRQDEAWRLKEQGLTGSAIAAQMRTTRNAVIGLWKRYRERHGIAAQVFCLGPQWRPTDRTLVHLYQNGLTLQKIAERTGYGSASSVKNRLNRLGVDRRGGA